MTNRESIMNNSAKIVLGLAAASLLGACATMPDGPSVLALPGSGKSFDQFRSDDAECRQFALMQIGGKTARQAGNESLVQSAAVTTVVGAAVGALADGNRGAGTGAATGLVLGTAVGANQSQLSSYEAQRRYDYAYIQCMYAKGNRVPVSGSLMWHEPGERVYRPVYPPPPPPNYRPY